MEQIYYLKELSRESSSDRVEIADVDIDTSVPSAVRAEQYLAQIKNPYSFKSGDISVNVIFSSGGKTLKMAMISYLTTFRNID